MELTERSGVDRRKGTDRRAVVVSEFECLVRAIEHQLSIHPDTAGKIADTAGVSGSYISQLLRGKKGKTFLSLEKVCNALGSTLSDSIRMGQRMLGIKTRSLGEISRQVLHVYPWIGSYINVLNEAVALGNHALAEEAMEGFCARVTEFLDSDESVERRRKAE